MDIFSARAEHWAEGALAGLIGGVMSFFGFVRKVDRLELGLREHATLLKDIRDDHETHVKTATERWEDLSTLEASVQANATLAEGRHKETQDMLGEIRGDIKTLLGKPQQPPIQVIQAAPGSGRHRTKRGIQE